MTDKRTSSLGNMSADKYLEYHMRLWLALTPEEMESEKSARKIYLESTKKIEEIKTQKIEKHENKIIKKIMSFKNIEKELKNLLNF